mmetsp:Transcript_62479/g.148801  ORF Transcript_62479/g.148801 Transcript_62479/m.148801 type:complete len:262 (-) Transcript_62479:570-1355(-)
MSSAWRTRRRSRSFSRSSSATALWRRRRATVRRARSSSTTTLSAMFTSPAALPPRTRSSGGQRQKSRRAAKPLPTRFSRSRSARSWATSRPSSSLPAETGPTTTSSSRQHTSPPSSRPTTHATVSRPRCWCWRQSGSIAKRSSRTSDRSSRSQSSGRPTTPGQSSATRRSRTTTLRRNRSGRGPASHPTSPGSGWLGLGCATSGRRCRSSSSTLRTGVPKAGRSTASTMRPLLRFWQSRRSREMLRRGPSPRLPPTSAMTR